MTLRQDVNRLTALLLVAIAALAATAIHYARALNLEQGRPEHVAIPDPARPPQAVSAPAMDAAFSASDTLPRSAGNATDMEHLSAPETRDVGTIAVARARLARLKDPQGRAERARQLADDVRREIMAELVPALGFTSAEVDHLVESAAGLALKAEEQQLECRADPACDLRKLEAPMGFEALVVQLLGPDKKALYEAYVDTAEERGAGLRLRERLRPGTVLTENTASKLATVLVEERQRFMKAAEQSGEKIKTHNAGTMGVTVLSAARSGSSDESAQRQASAANYIRRRMEAASTVLDGVVLERFRDSEEMALEIYKRALREREVMDAARRAAGKPAAKD